MNLVLRLIMPCRFPAWPAMMRPVAVTLKRFLALALVFILGISHSWVRMVRTGHGSPFRRACRENGLVDPARVAVKLGACSVLARALDDCALVTDGDAQDVGGPRNPEGDA